MGRVLTELYVRMIFSFWEIRSWLECGHDGAVPYDFLYQNFYEKSTLQVKKG